MLKQFQFHDLTINMLDFEQVSSFEVIPQRATEDDPYEWVDELEAEHWAVYARDLDGFAVSLEDFDTWTEAREFLHGIGAKETYVWNGEAMVLVKTEKRIERLRCDFDECRYEHNVAGLEVGDEARFAAGRFRIAGSEVEVIFDHAFTAKVVDIVPEFHQYSVDFDGVVFWVSDEFASLAR